MRGAVIGDLAAWTYEYDKDVFYRNLVDTKAELSYYGRVMAYENVVTNDEMKGDTCHAIILLQSLAIYYSGRGIIYEPLKVWSSKEDQYAIDFVKMLLDKLFSGSTKSEAYHSVPEFEQMSKNWPWKDQKNFQIGMLSCVFRAWNAFYLGFDFTSTLHNAMKWKKDRHIVAMLAGLFADAMYGSEYGFLKKKYTNNDTTFKVIDLDRSLEGTAYKESELNRMSDSKRTFFPKNRSLTNVERHEFQPVDRFRAVEITSEEYQTIKKAFVTDWDNRYGFYLDNGWIYTYRSGVVVCRFRVTNEDNHYYVDAFEMAEKDFKESCSAVKSVLYSCHLSDSNFYGLMHIGSLCKYYDGVESHKREIAFTTRGHFWHGENMYFHGATTPDWHKGWIERAKFYKKKLDGDTLVFANKYDIEQFAIIVYINLLFQKWCPYDDLKWIFEY